ncbi:MAG TPA: carbon-nitrogen hydrolase family protein [Ktedonobacterales bacterium]|nr:carbon-nitrogen hydrolase family protein [Ktedonobacterales bacterium]
MPTHRLGLIQMRCEKGDLAGNLDATAKYLDEGRERGVHVMVFPEASLTGYVDSSRIPGAVIALDHPAIADFLALTRRAPAMTVLAGVIEVNPAGLPFITQLVARDGALVGVYRKRTIPDEEAHLFAPAPLQTPGIFSHDGLRFGVAICADIDCADLFAEHAHAGARVIVECAAPGLYGEQSTRDWQAGYDWWRGECMEKLGGYARANGVHIAVATQAGRTRDEDFPGGGYLFAPDGRCVAQTPDWREGALWVEVETP